MANQTPPSAPISASPAPGWVVLIDHRRLILTGTLAVALIGLAVSFLLPKSYRVQTSLLILPPASVADLKLPPSPLHVTTLRTVAVSPNILNGLIKKIRYQQTLVFLAEAKVKRETDLRRENVFEKISAMNPEEAAGLLGAEFNETFETAWEDLPPPQLMGGYRDFDESDFKQMDSLTLSEKLSAEIHTSLETNVTTDYQPILNLEAEWKTKESAAILVYEWSRTIARYTDRFYLRPTLQLQKQRTRLLEALENDIAKLSALRSDLLAESDFAAEERRFDALHEELFGIGGIAIEDETQPEILPEPESTTYLLSELTELERELASVRSKCEWMRDLCEFLEVRGEWIGDFTPDQLTKLPAIQSRLQQVEGLPTKRKEWFRFFDTSEPGKQDSSPGGLGAETLKLESFRAVWKALSEEKDSGERKLDLLKEDYLAKRKTLMEWEAKRNDLERRYRFAQKRFQRFRERIRELGRTLHKTQAKQSALEIRLNAVQRAYDRVLEEGGLEARVTDYGKILKIRSAEAPMLPRKKYRPRNWLISLLSALAALIGLSLWVIGREWYQRLSQPNFQSAET